MFKLCTRQTPGALEVIAPGVHIVICKHCDEKKSTEFLIVTFCTRQTHGAREVIAQNVHIAMQAAL